MQDVPELMDQTLRVGKNTPKEAFLHSNLRSKIKSVGGNTRNAEEMKKKAFYVHNNYSELRLKCATTNIPSSKLMACPFEDDRCSTNICYSVQSQLESQ
ncbi:hypothetical protein AVEN_200923-1, partial [Araneus ventricosus]